MAPRYDANVPGEWPLKPLKRTKTYASLIHELFEGGIVMRGWASLAECIQSLQSPTEDVVLVANGPEASAPRDRTEAESLH